MGAAIKGSGKPRSDFFVTTKIPCCPAMDFFWGWAHTCSNDGVSARNATLVCAPVNSGGNIGTCLSWVPAQDQAHNLATLGLEQTDLLLMHWPCDDEADTAATWKAMEGLLAAGATKASGRNAHLLSVAGLWLHFLFARLNDERIFCRFFRRSGSQISTRPRSRRSSRRR
eukprot:SAG11_NODE_185_length_13160_cov_9.118521_3_plen_170_part_00